MAAAHHGPLSADTAYRRPGPHVDSPGQRAVTVEVARLQADGTWLWAIDQPNIIP